MLRWNRLAAAVSILSVLSGACRQLSAPAMVAEEPQQKKVVVCPLCAKAVLYFPEQESADAAVDRHTARECDPANYNRVHNKQRCPVPGCKERVTATNVYRCRSNLPAQPACLYAHLEEHLLLSTMSTCCRTRRSDQKPCKFSARLQMSGLRCGGVHEAPVRCIGPRLRRQARSVPRAL